LQKEGNFCLANVLGFCYQLGFCPHSN
jgi:hypothetical protein